MNESTLKGNMNELKAKAKKFWAKLTDDDFKDFDGSTDSLKGKVQKTYGYGKDQLDQEWSRFEKDDSSSMGSSERRDTLN